MFTCIRHTGKGGGASPVEVCILSANRGVQTQDQSCCSCWRERQSTSAKGLCCAPCSIGRPCEQHLSAAIDAASTRLTHICCLQVKLTFGRFLQDAALFYRQLACKLQAAYGDVGFSLADAQLQAQPAVPHQQYSAQDCQASVYRCLICLGDIFRFASSSVQKKVAVCQRVCVKYCGGMAWPPIS